MNTVLIIYLALALSGAIPFTFYLKKFIREIKKDKQAPVVMIVAIVYLSTFLLVFQIWAVVDYYDEKFPIWKRKFLQFKNNYIPDDIELTLRIVWKKPISEE